MSWYKIAKSDESSFGMKREFSGLVVNIENPAGTERVGVNNKGKEWRTKMLYDYGFIYSVKGTDGDALDVYLGPDQEAEKVYIVHQNDPETGEYDEDKCMCGFSSAEEAKEVYLKHYDTPKFFGSMSEVPFEEFKDLVENGKREKINWKKRGIKASAVNGKIVTASLQQESWEKTYGDYQRWVIDMYEVKVFLTKSHKFASISLNVWNWHNGLMVFQDFWKYDLKEYEKSKSTFKKIVKACSDAYEDFVKGDFQTAPNSMFYSYIRNSTWDIDREHLAQSNIPHINYARQKATYEKDWRSTLYGNRYPKESTTGF